MRIVFFGTPEFAVPTLEAVAREHDVVLVVAQPDKPSGRGMQMQAPPVAVRAKEIGLPLTQPQKIRDAAFLDQVRALRPDAGVVIAYGKILPAALLEIPPHGFLNVHASLLPKYRGAAPIQRAIAAGDAKTGVTIMRLDEQMDHGPMLDTDAIEIGPDERAPSVTRRLAEAGPPALLRVLGQIAAGTAVETPQDHDRATLAPKIEKNEGAIDWNESASAIYSRFRAFDPWPGLFFTYRGETIKVADMRPAGTTGEPGTILEMQPDGVTVAAGGGSLLLITIQRPGKARAAASDVGRGLGWRRGERLQ